MYIHTVTRMLLSKAVLRWSATFVYCSDTELCSVCMCMLGSICTCVAIDPVE